MLVLNHALEEGLEVVDVPVVEAVEEEGALHAGLVEQVESLCGVLVGAVVKGDGDGVLGGAVVDDDAGGDLAAAALAGLDDAEVHGRGHDGGEQSAQEAQGGSEAHGEVFLGVVFV